MKRFLPLSLAAVLLLGAAGPGLAATKDLAGRRAPDFVGSQVSGQPLSLSTFLGKVPVVLSFWSIYCKSCTEEMAALQRLFEKYGPRQVAVIAVNEDGDVGIGRVRRFLDRFGSASGNGKITFPTFFDGGGEAYEKYGVVHLPTLIYIDREGIVREVVEGFDRGSQYSVTLAIEKLIGAVSPEPLKEVAAEAVFDLDTTVPVCGVYRDGKWFRPLDLDESGRPEALARARAQGEEFLRREAVRLALARLGVGLDVRESRPGCFAPYGLEIRTPRQTRDALDLLLDRLNLPRILEVTSQETVEREQDMILYRRIRINTAALKELIEVEGYTTGRTTLKLRFVQASPIEVKAFLEAVKSQFPFLASLRPAAAKGGEEYLLECHAAAEKAIERLRALDIGARKLSVDLFPGDIAEVAMWR